MLPARVSHRRSRYPLRRFTRSSLTCPYAAPHAASASAPISASANACTIARSRSGLACTKFPPTRRARSTPVTSAVVHSVSLEEFASRSKDQDGGRPSYGNTPQQIKISRSVHHVGGR